MKFYKLLITSILLIIIKTTSAQFIDANILFKPRFALETESILPQSSNNLDGYSTNASLLIPIKNNFDLGVSIKDVLSSRSIKDALKKVQPKMSQMFLRLDGGYSELYGSPYQTIQTNQVKIGITGVKIAYKNLKVKSLLYSVNAGIFESFDFYKTPSIYANGMIGTAQIINLKSILFYGVYASYYDGQFLGTPILGYLNKLTPKLTFTAILPSQTKLTIKHSKKIKQDLIFGLYTSNFGNIGSQNTQRVSLRNNNLYVSTQARIKFTKSFHLYLEGGYKFNRKLLEKEGYKTVNEFTPNNGIYAKGTLIINFNKALLNSSAFDLDI